MAEEEPEAMKRKQTGTELCRLYLVLAAECVSLQIQTARIVILASFRIRFKIKSSHSR